MKIVLKRKQATMAFEDVKRGEHFRFVDDGAAAECVKGARTSYAVLWESMTTGDLP